MRLKGGKFQTQEIYHTRGYMSAVENIIHFGYKDIDQIESLEILWPDGSFEKISSIGSKNEIQFDYQNSIKKENAIINFPLTNKDYEVLFSQTAKKEI